jgi:hypothetical protein
VLATVRWKPSIGNAAIRCLSNEPVQSLVDKLHRVVE